MKRKKKPISTTKKNHTVYINSLEILVDMLFEEAARQKMTWSKMAQKSELSYDTIKNLGTRQTKYPAYRTVQLLAHALGGKVQFSAGRASNKRPHIHWTPKIFAA